MRLAFEDLTQCLHTAAQLGGLLTKGTSILSRRIEVRLKPGVPLRLARHLLRRLLALSSELITLGEAGPRPLKERQRGDPAPLRT